MAYTKKQIERLRQKMLKNAKEKRFVFLDQVISDLGVSRQTFYNWQFDKIDELKEIIENNRSDIKSTLRNKWLLSDNPTMNVALYKLLGTKEERLILADKFEEDLESKENKTLKVEFVNASK